MRPLIGCALCLLIATPSGAASTTTASWYSTESCRTNPDARCPTASGQSLYALEAAGALFAASWDSPLGSRLRVCRAEPLAAAATGREATTCLVVRVLDRGPARRLLRQGRRLDLGRAAFARLAPLAQGLVTVTIEPMP